jgi:hypothetical protein
VAQRDDRGVGGTVESAIDGDAVCGDFHWFLFPLIRTLPTSIWHFSSQQFKALSPRSSLKLRIPAGEHDWLGQPIFQFTRRRQVDGVIRPESVALGQSGRFPDQGLCNVNPEIMFPIAVEVSDDPSISLSVHVLRMASAGEGGPRFHIGNSRSRDELSPSDGLPDQG